MKPTKEQMYQWYVVEQKSYRQIMTITGIKNNRRIPKYLKEYGIEIRHGSDAVKTQWVNNESRKKANAAFFTEMNKGKPSPHRLSDDKLAKRLALQGFDLIERKIVDSYTVMKLKCQKCGAVTEKKLTNTSGCYNCSLATKGDSRRLKPDVFEKRLLDKFNGEFIALDEYKNGQSPLRFKHINCGVVSSAKPINFLNAGSCKNCLIKETAEIVKRSRRKRKKYQSHEHFSRLVDEAGDGEYKVVGQFRSANFTVEIEHLKCGTKWHSWPSNFLVQGNRCPRCNESKGERRIKEYLTKKGFEFKRQYRIAECRHKRPLPFDFAIFDNGDLRCLIEYDGAQHFKPIEFFGGKEKYRLRRIRDSIKRSYCKENRIPLIEISYTEENIEDFLELAMSQKIGKQLSLNI